MAGLITKASARWPYLPNEDPIWGLLRIVMAQQITTRVACRLAEKAKAIYPFLAKPSSTRLPEVTRLRELGLSERRAHCCLSIVHRSEEIRARVGEEETWEEVLAGIKGIGPWTIAVFRIMVLRDPDVLPSGDVGLQRAVANIYGVGADVTQLGERWRPYRSVACWYLWRTLGNEQLG